MSPCRKRRVGEERELSKLDFEHYASKQAPVIACSECDEAVYARGRIVIVRYADDFVMGFENKVDALNILLALKERLGSFWTSAPRRQDAADRVWPVRGFDSAAAWRAKGQDLRLPGLLSLLWSDP